MNAPTDSPGSPVSAALACSDIMIVKMAIDDSTGKQAPKTPATFWMLPTVKLILRCWANSRAHTLKAWFSAPAMRSFETPLIRLRTRPAMAPRYWISCRW